jgi:ubiquinone/menaquinone biosynthesis C-methylase UbiE
MNPPSQPTFPQMYEQRLVNPLFRPWAELAVKEMKLSPPDRVLDIACGTGIVARVAKERIGPNGSVVGIDINPDMLAVARSVAPDIEWREGSALALPLREGEQFDAVFCQQGLQFFPDKPAAASQMRKALTPGGRIAVATWRSDDEVPFFLELRRVAERHVGPVVDQRYSFGDGAALEALLREAGFHEVRSQKLTRTIRFQDGGSFVRMNAMGLVAMSTVGKAMDEGARKHAVEAIVAESASTLRSYSSGTDLAFEVSTNLGMAKG